MTRDECWDDWEAGDTCEWDSDREREGPFVLTQVQHKEGYVYWTDKDGKLCMTRETNLVRIAKRPR